MFFITEAPLAAAIKPWSSHAEHALIGMVEFCARIAGIAVIEPVPGTRPKRMILRLGGEQREHLPGDVGGAHPVDLGGDELEAVMFGQRLHAALVREADGAAVLSSATRV